MARVSDRSAGDIDRRTFLGGAAMLLLWPTRGLAQPAPEPKGVVAAVVQLVEKSKFAYVSPLRTDGAESTCHGEVWFAWLDGAVLVNTRRGTWKVKAVEKGLDRARIWIGDTVAGSRGWAASATTRSARRRTSMHMRASRAIASGTTS